MQRPTRSIGLRRRNPSSIYSRPIAQRMNLLGLRSIMRRRFNATTNSEHRFAAAESFFHILKTDLRSTEIGIVEGGP